MFETILVPLDGSELSESALAPALELKAKFGSQLVLLRAIETESHLLAQPAMIDAAGAAVANVEIMEKLLAQLRADTKTYLQAVQQRTGTDQVEALMIEDDDTAAAIGRVAREKNATLIVMSSHGRGGLGRALFGSTADAILRHSHVPVLLVRHTHDA